jgi:hypothetical protein
MLTRRNSLRQIIALGVAPAIIRCGILMPIKTSLASIADEDSWCVELSPGVFASPCMEPVTDQYGCLTAIRNTNSVAVPFHPGIMLAAGEVRILSKSFQVPVRVPRLA